MHTSLSFLLILFIIGALICKTPVPKAAEKTIDEEDVYRLDDFYDSARPPPIQLNDNPLSSSKSSVRPRIMDLMKEFLVTNEQLKEYERRLVIDLKKGLNRQTHNTSIVKCFVTYIQDLPTGLETGTYLAVDLGGTNFRVLMVELGGPDHLKMTSMQFAVPQEKMLGTGDNLFSYLADCIAMFVEKYNLKNGMYSMGFTFSFPLSQKSLNKALIERWTKGFNCTDVVGQDVGKLLQDAIVRKGMKNIKIKVVINDTTGTLISGAWKNPDCKIGLIIGTGTNACYVEKQKCAQLFDNKDRGSGKVLINTEWGAFGDDGSLDFIRTKYDLELDSQTINPGRQVHEKMISGMYMGEIVRVLLVHAVKDGSLFGGKGSNSLFTRNMFLTKYVSQIEGQRTGTHGKCMQIFGDLGLPHITEEDCLNVRYICECVSSRAAYMVSAGICGLIRKMGERNVAVGIDGSVYLHHPHVHRLMMNKIQELLIPGVQFQLMLSEDGSGRGAALAAAVAAKYEA
ncbi:hexokinase type 2-like [Coccinella septempunctata]|uniref:hexokinase type 2-like n=1 Tax=Coccinella septempunctata TaxID=41139 RepID=UPI001D098472|nr:hexokinase type 2-like [Coccinella septempunctata]